MNELPGTPLNADPPPTEPPPQTGTDIPKGDREEEPETEQED